MTFREITESDKELINKSFGAMTTLEDFITLLNLSQSLIYNQMLIKIDEHKIKFLAHPNSSRRYKTFQIKKKSGGIRNIHAPKGDLKIVLRCINLIFQCVYKPHPSAYGFVDGRSVVDNAKLHINKNYVFNIDLKDFFPSIEIGRILNRFSYPPFNFNKENGREQIGNYIAWLCCENIEVERQIDGKMQSVIRQVLPQGSPVSPVLTNIICEKLDRRLDGVAKRFGVKYSRYADDITFSSDHNVYHKDGYFRTEVEKIIGDQYFTVNQKKVRLQKTNTRQEVTGITVNKNTNVARRYVKQLRMWLYYWENYGETKALSLFLQSYIKDKGHVKPVVPTVIFMESVIKGKLNYLSMVKGKDNPSYMGLLARYEKLSSNKSVIDQLLDVWESDGIEAAMKKEWHGGR